MLKQIFKLLPDQYENFYLGNEVQSTSGTTLQLNLETFSVTINGTTILDKTQYIVEIFNKYVTTKDVEDIFKPDELDYIATPEELIDLVDSLFEQGE